MLNLRNLMIFFIAIYCLGIFAEGTIPLGSGTETEPYQIATLDNLLWLSTTESCWGSSSSPYYFIQTADINAYEAQNWNDGAGFSPIGTDADSPFNGSYDGQGYSIINLDINRPSQDYVGLFGYIESGKLININILFAEIYGYDKVGVLVGWLASNSGNLTIIENCTTTGLVDGRNEVGGLIGFAESKDQSTITVDNCNTETVTHFSYSHCGGLIGVAEAHASSSLKIENSHSLGSISYNGNPGVNGYITGGLIGRTYSYQLSSISIIGCSSSSNVDGEGEVGGFIGAADAGSDYGYDFDNSTLEIMHCNATGQVVSHYPSNGGFIGMITSNTLVTIFNCYSTGSVVTNSSSNGGFIGSATTYMIFQNFNSIMGTINIEKCYSLGEVDGIDKSGGFIGYANGLIDISRCYSKSDVSGGYYVGGFLGLAESHFNSSWNTYTVDVYNCYALGSVIGNGDDIGGLIGTYNYSINEEEPGLAVYNSFWNIETSGQTESYLGTGMTTEQMLDINTYLDAGWSIVDETVNDLSPIWKISPFANGGYPYLNVGSSVDVNVVDYDFGDVACNHQNELELMVGNSGNNISFCSIETEAPFYIKNSINELVNSLEFYIGEDDTTVLALVFAPTETATYNSIAIITTDDANNEAISLTLTGGVNSVDIINEDVSFITNSLSNYPNPFNPETTIYFSNYQKGNVTLEVFNIKGQKVRTLVNSDFEAGEHSIVWKGKDNDYHNVASGVYFYKLKAGNYTKTKKMVLMK